MNIEYTRMINPINAKRPKTIDFILLPLLSSPTEKDFFIAFFPASVSDCDIFPGIVLEIGLFSCLCDSLMSAFVLVLISFCCSNLPEVNSELLSISI